MSEAELPLHDPNPQAREAFPVLLLSVRDEQMSVARRSVGRLHWHSDLQILLVSEGSVDVDCAGEHFKCSAGEAVILNSGVPHRVAGRPSCAYASLLFPPKLLAFFPGSEMAAYCVDPYVSATSQPFCLLDGAEPWHAEALDELRTACDLLVGESDERQRYQACAHLCCAWGIYVAHVRPELPSDAQRLADERLKACAAYIDQHLGEHVTLASIAAAAGIGKSECARVFRRCLQTSPYAYLTEVRLARAIALMQEGELQLTAIAPQVGFGSPSHFSNAFKKAFGISPSAYLATLRNP